MKKLLEMAGSNKVEYSAADLSAMMVGKDTLQGWDVLVAYQVDALNKLLAAQHAGLKAAQITFDVKYRGVLSDDAFGALANDNE